LRNARSPVLFSFEDSPNLIIVMPEQSSTHGSRIVSTNEGTVNDRRKVQPARPFRAISLNLVPRSNLIPSAKPLLKALPPITSVRTGTTMIRSWEPERNRTRKPDDDGGLSCASIGTNTVKVIRTQHGEELCIPWTH
jgi:hypothetical protein